MSGFNNQEIHFFFVYMFGFSNQENQIFGIFIRRTIQAVFFCSQSIPVFGYRNRDSVIKILVDLCLDLEIENQ